MGLVTSLLAEAQAYQLDPSHSSMVQYTAAKGALASRRSLGGSDLTLSAPATTGSGTGNCDDTISIY
jgi:hypothetical protein